MEQMIQITKAASQTEIDTIRSELAIVTQNLIGQALPIGQPANMELINQLNCILVAKAIYLLEQSKVNNEGITPTIKQIAEVTSLSPEVVINEINKAFSAGILIP
jgi:hypothetical protein